MIIDRLIREGKIDVSEVEGHWEAYTSTIVNNPMQGVSKAVVIAGELCHWLLLHKYVLTNFQEPTREEPPTDCTLSRNNSVFRHGTSGPIRRHRSTALSTRSP